MKNILITGGSGLVGKHLTNVLLQNGYEVAHLGRKAAQNETVKTYVWNYEKKYIDADALKNVDVIINLAGANVGEGRWTEARKKVIYDSRIKSTALLFETLREHGLPIKKVISASAVGYYASSSELMTEESPEGGNFLAKVCADWETEARRFSQLDIPLCILRIGIVLSANGGFATEMAKPIKMLFGAAMGSGKQHISWIHIDDLCSIFLQAIENENYRGIYNAVGTSPASNQQITQEIARLLKKPLWLPNIPAMVLKIVLGGFSYELLVDHNISAGKLINSGFVFKYNNLTEALKSVLHD